MKACSEMVKRRERDLFLGVEFSLFLREATAAVLKCVPIYWMAISVMKSSIFTNDIKRWW